MRRVAAVILAAGASTRLGEPKQLVLLRGERLLERAVRTAWEAGCEPVVVVLGASSERILGECDLGAARVVVNEAWPEGMASSLRAGVAAVQAECDAVVVMTCDQPAVTAKHLKRLVELCLESAVASAYAGRQGVPACFPACCLGEVLLLRGDKGARLLLESAQSVALDWGELDVDTPEALFAARAMFG